MTRSVATPAALGGGAELALVGESAPFREMIAQARRVAATDIPVLLLGETGTGKDALAAQIHAWSGRRGAFTPVNCGAIPDELAESTFFGHRRGAFTGAVADRHGVFAAADGGTLFLDEIGELPARQQTKLLRVLEDQEFLPVGGTRALRTDARVIAATNADPAVLRRDLYNRLAGVVIRCPPLRARRADLPLLLTHFLAEVDPRRGWSLPGEVLDQLLAHDWPGNLRELRALARRLALLGPREAGALTPAAVAQLLDAQPLIERADRGEPAARVEAVERRPPAARGELDWYKLLVESAPDAVFVGDPAGRLVDVNAAAAEHLRANRRQLLARSPFEFVEGLTPALYRLVRAESERTQAPVVVRCVNHAFDGTEYLAETSVRWTSFAGEPLSFVFERHLGEREWQNTADPDPLELATRAGSRAPFVIVDQERRITELNAAAAALFRLPPGDAVGASFEACCGLQLRHVLGDALEYLKSGAIARHVVVWPPGRVDCYRADGVRVELTVALRPVEIAGEGQLLLTFRDPRVRSLPGARRVSPAEPLATLAEAQRTHILAALDRTRWIVSGPRGAARVLGLRPTTLESRMKKLGIARPR